MLRAARIHSAQSGQPTPQKTACSVMVVMEGCRVAEQSLDQQCLVQARVAVIRQSAQARQRGVEILRPTIRRICS